MSDVYVGPYVEITARVERRATRACPRPDECPNPASPYCPMCGKQTPLRERVESTTIPDVDPYAIVGDSLSTAMVEDLPTRRVTRLIPNTRFSLTLVCDIVDEDDYVEIDGEEPALGRAWLAEEYTVEIGKLRDAGLSPVVKWGVIVW